jgi:hypothetical protein
MLIVLNGKKLNFRFAAADYEDASRKTCGFADTKLILHEDFTAGTDRRQVHDWPSAHPYGQKGRDRLVTSI